MLSDKEMNANILSLSLRQTHFRLGALRAFF